MRLDVAEIVLDSSWGAYPQWPRLQCIHWRLLDGWFGPRWVSALSQFQVGMNPLKDGGKKARLYVPGGDSNAHLRLITHYSWRKALIEVNPGVSAHVMNAVGFDSSMCSTINQLRVFRREEMARHEHREQNGREHVFALIPLLMLLAGRAELQ